VEATVPDEPIAPPAALDDELVAEELTVDVATQPEDEDPLALAGDAADPPADRGRPEGVGP